MRLSKMPPVPPQSSLHTPVPTVPPAAEAEGCGDTVTSVGHNQLRCQDGEPGPSGVPLPARHPDSQTPPPRTRPPLPQPEPAPHSQTPRVHLLGNGAGVLHRAGVGFSGAHPSVGGGQRCLSSTPAQAAHSQPLTGLESCAQGTGTPTLVLQCAPPKPQLRVCTRAGGEGRGAAGNSHVGWFVFLLGPRRPAPRR